MLWNIIQVGVLRSRRSHVPLVIIVDMLQYIWTERNDICYRGSNSQLPITLLLKRAVLHVQAVMALCSSGKKLRIWRRELVFLEMAANPETNLNH